MEFELTDIIQYTCDRGNAFKYKTLIDSRAYYFMLVGIYASAYR